MKGMDFLLGILATLLITGCTKSTVDVDDEWFQKQEVIYRHLVELPEEGEEAEEPADELAGKKALQDYVDYALQNNPEIVAARNRARALHEIAPQVDTLDDPQASIAAFAEPVETAAGAQNLKFSASQKFPYFGKLELRGKVAEENARIAEQDQKTIELKVIARVKSAYYELYYAHKAIEINRENFDLMKAFSKIADTKYATGKAEQQDVWKAEVELSKLNEELTDLKQRLTTVESDLNRLLDRRVDAPLSKPDDFEIKKLEQSLQQLEKETVENRPDLIAVEHAIEREKTGLELAKKDYYPDLTVKFDYILTRDGGLSPVANGDDPWSITANVNIPIWYRRLDAAVRESELRLKKFRADYFSEINDCFFELRDLIAKLESNEKSATLFKDAIIPQAKQTLDSSLASYQAGRENFLTVVDNWRKLINFELLYYRELVDFEQNFAELERAVGTDLRKTPPGEDDKADGEDDAPNGTNTTDKAKEAEEE